MWKCGYRYLSCEKLHKICQLVPTLQIREQVVNIIFFSAVSCSFLNASIHFLWTLNYAMTEYRVILLTANFSICLHTIHMQSQHNYRFGLITHTNGIMVCILSLHTNCYASACVVQTRYMAPHTKRMVHCMELLYRSAYGVV